MRAALQAVTIVAVLEHAVAATECPAALTSSSYAPEMIQDNGLCLMGRNDFSKATSPNKLSVTGLWGREPKEAYDTCTADKDSFKMACDRITLALDGATCSCKQMAIHTEADATELSLHLDFEKCTAGAPASDAVVNMAIKKVPDEEGPSDSILEYFDGVCTKPTVAPEATKLQVFTKVKETEIAGHGACEGTPSTMLGKDKAPTSDACGQVCLGIIEGFAAVENGEGACTGYSYSEDTTDPNVCLLYDTKIEDHAETNPAGTWKCWTEKGESSVEESKPKDVDMAKLEADYLAKIPSVSFDVKADIVEFETVTSKLEGCFTPYTWIDLKDSDGGKGYVPIKASEWDKFLSYVPVHKEGASVDTAANAVGCKMSSGKIWYKGDGGPVKADEGEKVIIEKATCPPPPVLHEQYESCTTSEYINAAITAVVVPLLTWICVWILNDRCFKDSQKGASKPGGMNSTISGTGMTSMGTVSETGSSREVEGGGCDITVVLILVLAVALVAGISASLLAHILGLLLTPICGASSHDLNLITEGISVATFVACAAAVWFMSTRPTKVVVNQGSKYKLLQVKADLDQALKDLEE
mmetsp:Transcript_29283/g.53981  ORF Transcript_29283/g.53981 Transcript_29283/m.53981 type:complete len:585 (-) Transcript_29283:203-1957(-)